MNELVSNTEFLVTLAIFLAAACAIGVIGWLERRPRTSLNPRLIPTTPVLLIVAFIGILALVHLANMYGIHTGNRTRY